MHRLITVSFKVKQLLRGGAKVDTGDYAVYVLAESKGEHGGYLSFVQMKVDGILTLSSLSSDR